MHALRSPVMIQRADEALEAIGLKDREAKSGSESWRFETALKDFGEAIRHGRRHQLGARCRCQLLRAFRGKQSGRIVGNSLPTHSGWVGPARE